MNEVNFVTGSGWLDIEIPQLRSTESRYLGGFILEIYE